MTSLHVPDMIPASFPPGTEADRQTWLPSELDEVVLITMSVSPEAEPLVLDQRCLLRVAGRTEWAISADPKSKTVTFSNGDVKHMLADGKVVSSVVAWCQTMILILMSLLMDVSDDVCYRCITTPSPR